VGLGACGAWVVGWLVCAVEGAQAAKSSVIPANKLNSTVKLKNLVLGFIINYLPDIYDL
jgi:hypothetical protein